VKENNRLQNNCGGDSVKVDQERLGKKTARGSLEVNEASVSWMNPPLRGK
jgi:hypothetical protein